MHHSVKGAHNLQSCFQNYPVYPIFQALSVFPVMLKRVSTSLSAFVVLASKIWAFVVYVFKKQTRAVRLIIYIGI